MERNFFKNKIIVLIYLLMISEPILGATNIPNSNKNNFDLENILKNVLKNNNISDISDIMSKIPNDMLENPGIKIEKIVINNDMNENNIVNENSIKCYDYFHAVEQELQKYNNDVDPSKIFQDMNMPEYCIKEYNKFYQSMTESLITQIKKVGNFNFNIDFKTSLFDVNLNVNNNNNASNKDDKKNHKSYDDELEQYYIKSRKDCVEYGLRSPDEDIIVCTKYE